MNLRIFPLFLFLITAPCHGMQSDDDYNYPCGPCRNCAGLYAYCSFGTLRSAHLQASNCFQVHKPFKFDGEIPTIYSNIPLISCLKWYVSFKPVCKNYDLINANIEQDEENKYKNSIIALLEHRANPNQKAPDGTAVLYHALKVPWAVKLLMAYGTYAPNYKQTGYSDIHHIVATCKNGTSKVTQEIYSSITLLHNITPVSTLLELQKDPAVNDAFKKEIFDNEKMKAYRKELLSKKVLETARLTSDLQENSSISPLLTVPPEIFDLIISFWTQSWCETWTKNYRARLKQEALEWYATQPQS